MAKINNDTIAGFIMLAYSLIHIFYLTPDQVEMHQSNTVLAMSPRLFCYITAGTLGVLSAVLITMSFSPKSQKAAADAKTPSWEPLMRGLFCTAIACAYVAMASVLGFFVSTTLAMIVLLFYFGVKNWKGILLFLVVVLGFLYLFFVKALKVVMPDGLLF
jgi:MFS family permease